MNKKEKLAVAIAQDVIAQVNAKKYIAERGTYIDGTRGGEPTFLLRNKAGQLQDVLLKYDPKCTVCALGSAFLSAVRLTNNFVVEGSGLVDEDHWSGICLDSDVMRFKLEEFFTEDEVEDIETMFEQDRRDKEPAREALVSIMEEVVRQKGHFNISLARFNKEKQDVKIRA